MQSNVINLSDQAVKTEDLYLSDTIKYLVSIKDDIHDRSQIPHRDQVFQRVFDENPCDIQALKAAKAFAAFLYGRKRFILILMIYWPDLPTVINMIRRFLY